MAEELAVNVMVLVPLPITAGPEQVTPEGKSEQAGVTVPVKPPFAVTVSVTVPVLPLETVTVEGLSDKLKSAPPVVLVHADGAFTRFATLTEPRPVAASYPVAASNPVSTPTGLPPLVQFGLPFTQGMAMVPLVMSLKMQAAAGGPLVLHEPLWAANKGYKISFALPCGPPAF